MRRERKITRLPHFDYRSNGAYAITICSFKRRCVFGNIENGVMDLNRFGRIVQRCFLEIPAHFPQVELDEFIVMPNHFHGIMFINGEAPPTVEEEKRYFGKPVSGSLGIIVGSFKGAVTKSIGEARNERTYVWQPKFFEHIIRNDLDLQHQREYILNNPLKWLNDDLFIS